jgi:hypothetical protein
MGDRLVWPSRTRTRAFGAVGLAGTLGDLFEVLPWALGPSAVEPCEVERSAFG